MGLGQFCDLFEILIIYSSYTLIGYLGVFEIISDFTTCRILHTILFSIIGLLSISCHLASMLSDPGKVNPEEETLINSRGICYRCNLNKAPRTHHCTICDKCIINKDFHCFWIKNCVGFNNQKHFILFNFYTIILCAWFIVINIVWLCSDYNDLVAGYNLYSFSFLISLIWCSYFMYECSTSLYKQNLVILNNTSEIDVLQRRKFLQVIAK